MPVDNGTNLAFVSTNSGYTKLYGYVTRGQEDNPLALDISKVVANYIPNSMTMLVASPQNDFLALADNDANDIYLFRQFNDGTKVLVQAWVKWQVHGKVQTMAVINDTWFLITKNEDDSYVLGIAPIDQISTGEIYKDDTGIYGNPSIDLYTHPTSIAAGKGKDVDSYCLYQWPRHT